MLKRVFVVDDERLIADTLTAILTANDYEARPFYDAESALLACEASCPDCIICDVVMPGLSGLEMAIRVQHDFQDCKVILFSGQAATSDMLEEALRRGYAFEVLLKPVHPRDLLARLEVSRPFDDSQGFEMPSRMSA
jgi:DNA-binding response OmpR family regulator